MAQLPKTTPTPQSKKAMPTGAKVAIIGGGIVVFLVVVLLVAGLFFAGSTFNFLRNNGVKVDEKNGSVEVTTQDGQSTFSSKAELPENYPSDVPVYPGAEVVYSVVKDGEGSNVTWRTKDSLQQVVDFYEAQLQTQGWAKTQNQTTYFTAGIGFAEKSPRSLAIIATEEKTNGEASTVIVVTEKSGQ